MSEKPVKKKKKSLVSFVFLMCIIVIVGLAVYFQFMKRQQMQQEEKTPTTETEKLIAKDLDAGYPETPTEVMKLWGRLNQCMYNTELEEEQFDALLSQMRALYSSELLAQNPEEAHKAKLQEDLTHFHDYGYKIVSYTVETGTDVQYKTINNKECAYLNMYYFINQKGDYTKNYQDYILVKEDGKWKILGFQEAKTEDVSKEEVTSKSS